MANIRIDSPIPISDGQVITFKSPADCSTVTGLIIYYTENEIETSKSFKFADAHGNNVGGIDLFAANVMVKVILDTIHSRAYVQNADTNAYLEARFKTKAPAGFGLGTEANWNTSTTGKNIDDIIENGWHVVSKGNNGENVPFATGTILVVARDTTGFCYQIAFDDSSGYINILVRKRTEGTWGAWEVWSPASFAPSGYGLGGTVKSIGSLDEVDSAGWYAMWFNKEDMPNGALHGNWTFYVTHYGGPNHFAIRMPANHDWSDYSVLSELTRWKNDGVWQPWEWEHPPMVIGVEYRTTKRIAGKPVYTKFFRLGDVSGGSTITVSMGENIGTWKNIVAITDASGNDLSYGNAITNAYADQDKIVVTVSGTTYLLATVEYIKSTD